MSQTASLMEFAVSSLISYGGKLSGGRIVSSFFLIWKNAEQWTDCMKSDKNEAS